MSPASTTSTTSDSPPESTPRSLVWERDQYGNFTDDDLVSDTLRNSDIQTDIRNRLCWCIERSTTIGEFYHRYRQLGQWVSSLPPERGALAAFQACDAELRSDYSGLPDGRTSEDVSGRRPECDSKGRSIVYITTHEADVSDAIVAVLKRSNRRRPEVYARGDCLVFADADGNVRRCVPENFRPYVTRKCTFSAWSGPKNDKSWQPAHPKPWMMDDILTRGVWPELPVLASVADYPVLLPDGRILCTPGYDPDSGILVSTKCIPIDVPEAPTQAEAVEASRFIWTEMFSDFPVAGPAYASALMAAFLTILARPAIAGPCPGFLFDGNAPGVGKGLAAQAIAVAATGMEFTPTAPENDETEWRKRIVAILRDAKPLTVIDNITGTFGSAALDGVLTSNAWSDRTLGLSQNWAGPATTVWYFTANNVAIRGDLARRLVPVRMNTPHEQPELRRDFRHPDLLAAMRRLRPDLLRAAFTILRSWWATGMPLFDIPALGSYESWSRIIRHGLCYSGWSDLLSARDYLAQEANTDLLTIGSLLKAWAHMQANFGFNSARNEPALRACLDRHARGSPAFSLHELLLIAGQFNAAPDVRAQLELMGKDGDLPSAVMLGRRLASYRDRVVGGHRLVTALSEGTRLWSVKSIATAP